MNQDSFVSNIITGPTCFEALKQDPRWQNATDRQELILLCDTNTEKECLPLLETLLFETSGVPPLITIPAGEESKSFRTIEYLIEALDHHGATRNTILVNLGGGVVTDIGGFAASIYKRGIDYINIPTTLIGQVDAAVGGKTGINFAHAKNQVGTFQLPLCVCIHSGFLQTLPDQEMNSGLGEMFKYAMIGAPLVLDELNGFPLDNPTAFASLVERCIRYKEVVTAIDPEEKGMRKALNFGHTIGHAIESCRLAVNLPVTHGAAVAAGVVAETLLSCQLNGLDKASLEKATGFYLDHFHPLLPGNITPEMIMGFIYQDKKNEKGKINPVLLDENGNPEWNTPVSPDDILRGLQYLASITREKR
ncbi:MAG: 3-dehydroquinate synthase family protein [Bacteroidales bacterium]